MDERKIIAEDLLSLANLPDSEIDLTTEQELDTFGPASTGRYYPFMSRGYDVRAIANWFIDRAQSSKVDVKKVWINKLVYLAYQEALKGFQILLTPARVEAWKFGPVFREIYFNSDDEAAQKFLKYDVKERKKMEVTSKFEGLDESIFEKVYQDFGALSASELTRLTHEESSPWHLVWMLGGEENPGMVIPPSIIAGSSALRKNGNSRNED